MLKNILVLIDTIIDNYVLAAERPEVDGATKKAAVVASIVAILEALASQFKVGGLVMGIAKLVVPFLVDLAVDRLTAAGLLNQHKADAAGWLAIKPVIPQTLNELASHMESYTIETSDGDTQQRVVYRIKF